MSSTTTPNFLPFFAQLLKSKENSPPPPASFFSQVRDSFTVATSSLSTWSQTLASNIDSLTSNLPLRVQSLIRNVTAGLSLKAAKHPESSTPFVDSVYSFLTTLSTTSFTTACALILAAVFAAYKFSMSYYTHRPSFDDGYGGRRSPYASTSRQYHSNTRGPNIDDHVEYITAEPPLSNSRYTYGTHRYSLPQSHHEDQEAPDILLLRHKHRSYELKFNPYTISDGIVKIRDVRDYAAELLKCEPGRLRMLYKGKRLEDDRQAAKAYGLKQHSEIMCIVSDAEAMNGTYSENSSEDDKSTLRPPGGPGRTRAPSTSRPRSMYQSDPVTSRGPFQTQPPAARPTHHPSNENLRAPDMDRQGSRSSNTTRSSPPPSPDGPLGKVAALASTFHTQWVPKCTQFIVSPPEDPSTRTKEYAKLNEMVLSQIMLKVDGIDTEGSETVRARRKELINEVQDVLKRLDAVGKPREK